MTCIRCLELEERILQLEAELGTVHDWTPPADLRLRGMQERAILCALINRPHGVQHWALYEAVRSVPTCYRNEANLEQVKVLVSKVRAKLRPFGLGINNIWGVGYQLPEETRTRLLNWNTTQSEAA